MGVAPTIFLEVKNGKEKIKYKKKKTHKYCRKGGLIFMVYKTKGEKDYEKLMQIREEYGDTFLLERILEWWGYEDSTQFLEENADVLQVS